MKRGVASTPVLRVRRQVRDEDDVAKTTGQAGAHDDVAYKRVCEAVETHVGESGVLPELVGQQVEASREIVRSDGTLNPTTSAIVNNNNGRGCDHVTTA